MKQYIKSIAILIFGLSFFHLFSTIQVYLSNVDLLNTLNSAADTGYLLMPNKFIMSKLKDISVAFAGGVFFTLSVGTFTVLVSFLASVFYFKSDGAVKSLIYFVSVIGKILDLLYALIRTGSASPHRCLYASFEIIMINIVKKYALTISATFFVVLIIVLNYKGICLVETLSFLLVPTAVFFLYKLLFATSNEKPEPIALAIHFIPVCILAVFLMISTINSSNKIFSDVRDNILMSNNVGMKINDFYYDYTLYPARVFKPYSQRTPKVCAIEEEKVSGSIKRIEQRLLQNDYLVVDIAEKPDFIILKDKMDVRLIYKGKIIVETTVSQFTSQTNRLLREFSQKTDKYGSYRQITSLSLKTGFPLYMYILMHFMCYVFFCFILFVFNQKRHAHWIASLCCLAIGVFAFLFIFFSESYEVNSENLSKILKSNNVKERIAGLRYIVEKKLDISKYADYDTSFSENYVPEKYWFARSLGNSRDSKSYDTLIQFLDDSNQNVVCQAFYSLGVKRKKEAINVIIEHIKTSKDWYVQWYAYRALKRLRWKQQK